MDLVQKWTFDYTELLNLDKTHDYITLVFAENGCFTYKKDMEKSSLSFLEDNSSSSVR